MAEETRKKQENGEGTNQAAPKVPFKEYLVLAILLLAVALGIVFYVRHITSQEYKLVDSGIWCDEITHERVIVFFEDGTAKSDGTVFYWDITDDNFLHIFGNGVDEKLRFYFEERKTTWISGTMPCLILIDENGYETVLQSRFVQADSDDDHTDWAQ